jgi:uncharacterized CHY-type Zn-finger protein
MIDCYELRECHECHNEVTRGDLRWVKDRYGIPFKLVCYDCHDKVEDAISKWEFDEADCGERLYDDY